MIIANKQVMQELWPLLNLPPRTRPNIYPLIQASEHASKRNTYPNLSLSPLAAAAASPRNMFAFTRRAKKRLAPPKNDLHGRTPRKARLFCII